MNIVIIPGSNRKGAQSLLLAKHIIADYTALGHDVDLLTMDLESDYLAPTAYKEPTPAITERTERFCRADGVVFVVPEYNGSFPGVLKLFIDTLPYPLGFDRRPCAFIGIAAGQFKGLRAVEHLQGVAGYRNALMFPNRVFIGESWKQFTPEGSLGDPELAKRLRAQAEGFVTFIAGVAELRPQAP
jgi:chromate reductase, NAD(P)H dehydrogenase (quinone)